MGFRNPPRTAAGVDTGLPAGAGVKIYQGSNFPAYGSFGVVEFRDGIGGDAPVQLIGRANYNPRAEGASLGGSLTLGGGSFNGVDMPALTLAVEEVPGGGYYPTVRLTGAELIDLGAVCYARQTVAVTSWSPNNWFGMPLQVTDIEQPAAFDFTAGHWWWVCPAPGEYACEGVAAMNGITAGSWIGARIAVNGVGRMGSVGIGGPITAAGGTSSNAVTGRKRYALNAGDTVALQAYSSAACSTRVTSDGITSTLLIERVG
jgi:hypothetical protein